MSNIRVTDLPDLEEKFIRLVNIMHKMRQAQKRWHVQFGYDSKKSRVEWEQKADEFLSELNIVKTYHHHLSMKKEAE